MFYSKDILARKDSSLGLVWYAATIGPRSSLGRLSKRELSKVDIVKACRDISQPQEALALRLSSNLMYGVTRVYGHQVNIVYVDANHTWAQIKRGATIFEIEQLDMPQPGAKFEAITFDDAPNIEVQALQMIKPAKLSHDLELEQARKSATNLAVEFGWASATAAGVGGASQTSLDPSSTTSTISPFGLLLPSSLAASLEGDGHLADPFLSPSNERRRRITLNDDHTLDDELLRRHRDSIFGLPYVDEELLSGVGDDGLYLDAEGNLLAVGDTAPATGISAVSAGKKRKLDYHDSIGGLFDGAASLEADQTLDDNLFGLDLSAEDRRQQQQRHHEQPASSSSVTAAGMLPTGDDGDDGIVPIWHFHPGQPVNPSSKRLKSGTQSWRRMMDDPTMLTQEEIQQARTEFVQDQRRASLLLKLQLEKKQALQMAREQLDGLLTRPVSLHGYGSDLAKFWAKVAAKEPLLPHTTKRSSAEAGPSSTWKRDIHTTATGATALGDDDHDMMQVPGYDYIEAADVEPELVRRQQQRGLMHGTDSAASSSSAASLLAPGSIMPWAHHNLPSGNHSSSNSSGGGSGHGSGQGRMLSDFEKAFEDAGPSHDDGSGGGAMGGGGPSRHRQWPRSGSNTPTGRQSRAASPQRRRSATTAIPTLGGAVHGDMDWALLLTDGADVVATTPPPFEGLWPTGTDESSSSGAYDTPVDEGGSGSGAGVGARAGAGESTLVDPHGHAVTVERDTASFLRYIQSILQDAKASYFHFSDVVMPHQKRVVAAVAFYHILALSTKGFMRPLQKEPYQDIRVALV